MSVDQYPIRRPVPRDAEALAKAVGAWDRPALLVGGAEFGEAGRYSIFAAEPRWVVEGVDGRTRFEDELGGRWLDVDPLDWLADRVADLGLADPAETPGDADEPFKGGLIRLPRPDLAPRLERLPRRRARVSRLPDLRFALYDSWAVIDHATGRAQIAAADLTDEGPAAARARLDRWERRLAEPPADPMRSRLERAPAPVLPRGEFLSSVARALDYIREGDIFQVNLSQRFEATGRIVPLDLFCKLRRASPAPFSALLAWDDLAIVSASPEWFYRSRGDRIVTRPIKGTRPRGATEEEDRRLREELLGSAKDRAELTMIVDLERNDLGRVAEYRSVEVSEALTVESYAQVHHLVATVCARLRPEVGPIDVIRATFPGGSITGAPKIRAMEIIDELEPARRSAYTGSLGYFSRGGSSAFNILIRTMLVEGDRVSYQVGGGIVADSDPALEYEETLHKGRGLLAVLREGSPP
ncbi:MAG: aminodeoxychorismate synthase component I [Isosphaeraceae bacterium]